jgi:nucleoid-associated protein YgaU
MELAMRDTSTRVLTGGVVLAVIWVTVYWIWQPGPRAVPLAAPERVPGGIVDPTVKRGPSPLVIGQGAGGRSIVDEPVVPIINRPPERAIERRPIMTTPEAGLVVVPPTFRDVTIQRGDTFGSIARRELGQAGLWTVIARANPGVDPNRLRPGMVVRVPLDPDNIQGKVVDAADPDRTPATPEMPQAPELEYTVSRGDTLSEIAKKFYGSIRYIDFLYEANRDRLRNKNDLRLGQVLRIPSRPAED